MAERSRSEEDLRIATHETLRNFASEAGFDLQGQHEVSFGTGRADSVYDAVVVEYKKPGRFTSSNKNAANVEAIEQLRKRFKIIATEQRRRLDHTFGVAFDGRFFIFLRVRDGIEQLWEPQPLSPSSVQTFLRRLASLGRLGRAFTASNLDLDFGAASPLARSVVQTLLAAAGSPKAERTPVLMAQWDLMFQEVCGYDLARPGNSVKALCAAYDAPVSKSRELLFVIHTYYAIIIKLIAAEILAYHHSHPSYLGRVGRASPSQLKQQLSDLETGGIYRQVGIANLLEGNVFLWYIDEWGPGVADAVHRLVSRMAEYDAGTLSVEPDDTEDLLKDVYQRLLPESLRHDLGEFYTPDWLADLTMLRANYDGNPEKRFLDPACGSGTFLIRAIDKVRAYGSAKQLSPRDMLHLILNNVVGFDLNPLAVMSARVNYIIALRDLLPYAEKTVTIPVFLCDSLLTPDEPGDLFEKAVRIRTAVGMWDVPRSVISGEKLSEYVQLLEDSVSLRRPVEEFVAVVYEAANSPPAHERALHANLYEKLLQLQAEKRNGVWARIIRNAFAPLFTDRFDYVIGNPPWINWEYLPAMYRRESEDLWRRYGLFTLSGKQARLGGGKKDLSMLFVYVGVDRFLRKGGRLSFVLSQGLFKSEQAGAGFRKNSYDGADRKKVTFQVTHADDLVRVSPFRTATTRAMVVCYKKGAKTTFPISYAFWRKVGKRAVPDGMTWTAARGLLAAEKQVVHPVRKADFGSQWLTGKEALVDAIRDVIGRSRVYQAYAGSCTWLNGVYWVEKLRAAPRGEIVIKNLHDTGKIEVPAVEEWVIEKTYIYPLLRGRDVHRWSTEPSCLIVQANDPEKRVGWDEADLRKTAPKTYRYLMQFHELLINRSGYVKYFKDKGEPFYSIHNVGPYTISQYKVVWKEQSNVLEAAVVGPDADGKCVIPDHKLMLVPTATEEEAHYICAMINSSPVAYIVVSYVIGVSISNSTHVLKHVPIPKFRPASAEHKRLADLSAMAHKKVPHGEATTEVEAEIDALACSVLGIPSSLAAEFREEVEKLA